MQRFIEVDEFLPGYKKQIKSERRYGIAPPEVLEKISRRENPRHPLVSLGIARSVGYEIEFQKTDFTEQMEEELLFQCLDFAGVRQGQGGRSAFEISPGPFWDPDTGNAIFKIYHDAGIVEPEKYENGFTFHFNVGLGSRKDMVFLIRALHLTGIPYNPHRKFNRPILEIYGKRDPNTSSYIECKAFEVMSPWGFEWSFKSASYLSWALAADQKKSSGLVLSRTGKELASIWRRYVKTVKSGLSTVEEAGDYLNSLSNEDPEIEAVRRQLKLIYPTPSSRYRDLNKVSGSPISKVRVGDRIWNNIAAFAKTQADIAVAGVERVAEKVEAEVIDDIRRIEDSSFEKDRLIEEFIFKYKVKVEGKNPAQTEQDAYFEVRKIFENK